MHQISLGKSFGWAGETFFNQWRLVLKTLLFVTLVPFIPLIFLELPIGFIFLNSKYSILGWVLPALIHLVIMLIIWTGMINIAMQLYQRGFSSLQAMFALPGTVLARVLVVGIIYHTIVMLGFICFIVPGFYLMGRYYFALYNVIFERTGITDSFTRAAEQSRDNMLPIIVLSIVSHILMSTGIFFFMANLMNVHAYGTRLGLQPHNADNR
jgi:hypothetical protein